MTFNRIEKKNILNNIRKCGNSFIDQNANDSALNNVSY